MSHPNTYVAYAFKGPRGQLEQVTVEWKDPTPGEIVVKVLACGVCASDVSTQAGLRPDLTYPRIPGHEIVGDVVAISPTEKKWKVGQRVGSGWHGGHCSKCTRCREGDFITCEKQEINGIHRDGGYAEYATLRSEAVASIPGDIDPAEAAPLLCAGVTTFNSLRNMSIQPPEIVAVQGIGGLGHLAIQFACKMGFRTIALSSSSAKEKLARDLGAHEYIDGSKEDQAKALQRLGGAKVIICTAPDPAAIEQLTSALAIGGTLLILAIMRSTISVPVIPLVVKHLSVRGWLTGTPADSEACVAFVKVHGIKTVVERFPLAKSQEAYDARKEAILRAVIVP